jgi:hypothetical protein
VGIGSQHVVRTQAVDRDEHEDRRRTGFELPRFGRSTSKEKQRRRKNERKSQPSPT